MGDLHSHGVDVEDTGEEEELDDQEEEVNDLKK